MKSFREYLTEERIDPKAYNLTALYTALNHTLFNSELGDYPIRWGNPPNKNAVAATLSKISGNRGIPRFMWKTVPGSINIVVRPGNYEHDVLYGVIAHEMVHAWNAQNNQNDPNYHGPAFTNKLHEIQRKTNIKIPAFDVVTDVTDEKPKDVGFLAGVTPRGDKALVLFSANFFSLTQNIALGTTMCDRFVEGGWKWACIGMAKTIMANHMTVTRDFKSLAKNMKAPKTFANLNAQRIYAQSGANPDFS